MYVHISRLIFIKFVSHCKQKSEGNDNNSYANVLPPVMGRGDYANQASEPPLYLKSNSIFPPFPLIKLSANTFIFMKESLCHTPSLIFIMSQAFNKKSN